ncbi:MAG TPA: hypothetical protein VFB38_06875 [Chthonomonadaceae bacterium]|nr:hypothetical protein [Chthonomonadaceae bacterium]
MPHPRFSAEEIEKRGQELYDRYIRAKVETEENIGKICCIDIETGNYAIADMGIKAARVLRDKHPDAAIWGVRIGYDAVYAVGGMLTRTTP